MLKLETQIVLFCADKYFKYIYIEKISQIIGFKAGLGSRSRMFLVLGAGDKNNEPTLLPKKTRAGAAKNRRLLHQ